MSTRPAIASAAAAIALAGCAGDGDDEPAPAPPVSTTTEAVGSSKDLRAFLRRRGRQDGAAWAGSIDRRGTVLRRGGEEAFVTVGGVLEERDLEEVCAAAKDYRTGPVVVRVSNGDGSLATDC